MKNCGYCGRENLDDAARCVECGTCEFVTPDLSAATPNAGDVGVIGPDMPVRDRPKLIIVAGIWAIYGSGLLGDILILFAVLSGTLNGILGLFCFWLSISCGALCAYLLYRVVKNYNIHKKRAADETVA